MRNDEATAASSTRWSGWRGVALIVATYVYFLIFAQFGFLKRLDELGIVGSHLKLVMAAMAVGGVLASLLAPRITAGSNPSHRLRVGLFGCGAAALLTTLPLTTSSGVAASFLIGISLGLLTVTLVANLDLWIGTPTPLLKVGLGTGFAYFICNIPGLFTASPKEIAIAAGLIAFAALLATTTPATCESTEPSITEASESTRFAWILVWFTALIWLDSAAFFIIQNSQALKSGTWEGAGHLWRNGSLHFATALGSAWLIRKRGLAFTLLCAFASLGGGCLVLLNPARSGFAAVLYPVGVSLYSVALVAAPAFLLMTQSRADRARKAGWVYAISGWVGSALGIGMGQNLHRVPPLFVIAAAVLFVVPWFSTLRRSYFPQTVAIVVSLGAAFGIQQLLVHRNSRRQIGQDISIAHGRRVYISEGCINCHSQYVRPDSPDGLMWGPTRDVEAIRREKPPLIGNRRQGPDLSEVGSRRSPLWLRIHFMNPRDLSYESIMPEYSYLFHDDRGEALVAYVASLKSSGSDAHLRDVIASWAPAGTPPARGGAEGQLLFGHYCATCHVEGDKVRGTWGSSFKRLPPFLSVDQLRYIPRTDAPDTRTLRIARIIKFGIPGTDMPGHEYLPDSQISTLSAWVTQMSSTGDARVNSVIPAHTRRLLTGEGANPRRQRQKTQRRSFHSLERMPHSYVEDPWETRSSAHTQSG